MNVHRERMRPSELEVSGEIGINETPNPTMGEIIGARFHRRDFLRGSLAVAAISAVIGSRALASSPAAAQGDVTSFDFKEIEAGVDTAHHVAEGYDTQILLRWGDPIFADAPEFDP